ncbi:MULTISPECIES: peptide chain release factor 2 [Francisella]|uniref:Peptide chain release factor 2 n=1 Tax=Francisella opportunistica TaxID=2016517 RepID=A0A345JPF6_9GAMM|nr:MULTISPECIES: peptide chain release factor 2 [Francisella]AXH29202.1 peptide chain release factor 2 [Francisella opportunistica]
MESINYKLVLKDLTARIKSLRDYLDYDAKKEKLTEVLMELEDGAIWDNPEYAQSLGKQKVELESVVNSCEHISETLETLSELLEMAEQDESLMQEIARDTRDVASEIEKLEFRRMFSGKMDANNAFLDIQSGSGGTEAQDWAEMLMRMYMRWADSHGFKVSVDNVSDGDVAGIKGCTLKIEGEYAYGWLRTETGIHRLVRKSPFDSNSKRHTSFASVFISPEVDDDIDIEINPADLRVDTYRASGAGGQHVNKTDSAVRITHIPTNIVVQSQSDRSQHKNRDNAMKQLKSKLYEMELQKRNAEKNALEDSKADIGWGSQIRSYVLDQSRIKDLRTGVENTNTQAVLDGDLDKFIEASLKSGL